MAARVLVTGSSGFVGGALGRWLREHQGSHVTGLSRTPPREGACDVHVAHDLSLGPPDLGAFDAIVHCAALAAPWAKPAAYESSNIAGLRHMLAYATRVAVTRFIFISSSAVHYVFGDQIGLTEESPLPKAINLYAASKQRGEAMVRASGLGWTIVRPRAVFGPGDTVVFPHILDAAKRGALPRLVRRDGVTPRADLLYIDNLCWFLARILERNAQGVFNLTNGIPVEIPDMLDNLFDRLALARPTRRVSVSAALFAAGTMEFASRTFLDWREPAATRFGVASLAFSKTFNITRARTVLGAPPVPLAEGMERFVAWQKPRLA